MTLDLITIVTDFENEFKTEKTTKDTRTIAQIIKTIKATFKQKIPTDTKTDNEICIVKVKVINFKFENIFRSDKYTIVLNRKSFNLPLSNLTNI